MVLDLIELCDERQKLLALVSFFKRAESAIEAAAAS